MDIGSTRGNPVQHRVHGCSTYTDSVSTVDARCSWRAQRATATDAGDADEDRDDNERFAAAGESAAAPIPDGGRDGTTAGHVGGHAVPGDSGLRVPRRQGAQQ